MRLAHSGHCIGTVFVIDEIAGSFEGRKRLAEARNAGVGICTVVVFSAGTVQS